MLKFMLLESSYNCGALTAPMDVGQLECEAWANALAQLAES